MELNTNGKAAEWPHVRLHSAPSPVAGSFYAFSLKRYLLGPML